MIASLFLPKTFAWGIGVPFGLIFLAGVAFISVSLINRIWLKKYRFPHLAGDEKESVTRLYRT